MASFRSRFKIRNKKGVGIDDALPIIVTLIVFALLVFAFRITDSVNEEKLQTGIQNQKDYVEAHDELTGYLSLIDEYFASNSQLVSDSFNEQNYSKLKKDMSGYFALKFGHLPRWEIEFLDQSEQAITADGEYFILRGGKGRGGFTISSNKAVAKSFIPIQTNPPKYVIVRLQVYRSI